MSVFVSGILNNVFHTRPTFVQIKKGDVNIELDEKEWAEVVATLKCERHYYHTELEEGEYTPREIFVHND